MGIFYKASKIGEAGKSVAEILIFLKLKMLLR